MNAVKTASAADAKTETSRSIEADKKRGALATKWFFGSIVVCALAGWMIFAGNPLGLAGGIVAGYLLGMIGSAILTGRKFKSLATTTATTQDSIIRATEPTSAPISAPFEASTPGGSVARDLARLAILKSEGHLTAEEFDALKADLLGNPRPGALRVVVKCPNCKVRIDPPNASECAFCGLNLLIAPVL